MIILLIYIIISFLLDGVLSFLIPFNEIFLFKSFFTIVSLVVLFPYTVRNKKIYYLIPFITGLFFDLIYTNTIILNALLFMIIFILIKSFYTVLQNNLFNGIVMIIISIFIYNIFTYFILNMIGINTLPFSIFFGQLIFIYIINIFYFIITYFIIKRLANRFHLEYIDK